MRFLNFTVQDYIQLQDDFQFSLWDSEEKEEVEKEEDLGFQFSLWDSLRKQRRYRWTVYLSILFMRFRWEVQELRRILLIFFQFSLWDSYYRVQEKGWKTGGLSILFMRFKAGVSPGFRSRDNVFQFSLWDSCSGCGCLLTIPYCSFNSLYEIRKDDRVVPVYGFINFQFSLWDS